MHFPITIGLHRSRFLDYAVLVVVLAITGFLLQFPRSTAVLIAILLLAWSGAALAWWRLKPEAVTVRLLRNGQLEVLPQAGEAFLLGRCLPNATVHPWLTVFRIETDSGQQIQLLVTADTTGREEFRRLRVFLRWQADFNDLPISGP